MWFGDIVLVAASIFLLLFTFSFRRSKVFLPQGAIPSSLTARSLLLLNPLLFLFRCRVDVQVRRPVLLLLH